MSFRIPRVYPITDKRLSGLSHVEQVKRLIEGGATIIQLRDKESTPRDFCREAEAAWIVARQHNVTLIINDRVDVALALRASGVHLGQTDLPATAARTLLGESAVIGLSTHNIDQVQLALKQPVDYLGFGPIFDTTTKTAPDPTIGLADLRHIRALTGLPIVAIGGITVSNAPDVLAAGADAVAVISSLVGHPDSIVKTLRKLLVEAV